MNDYNNINLKDWLFVTGFVAQALIFESTSSWSKGVGFIPGKQNFTGAG